MHHLYGIYTPQYRGTFNGRSSTGRGGTVKALSVSSGLRTCSHFSAWCKLCAAVLVNGADVEDWRPPRPPLLDHHGATTQVHLRPFLPRYPSSNCAPKPTLGASDRLCITAIFRLFLPRYPGSNCAPKATLGISFLGQLLCGPVSASMLITDNFTCGIKELLESLSRHLWALLGHVGPNPAHTAATTELLLNYYCMTVLMHWHHRSSITTAHM